MMLESGLIEQFLLHWQSINRHLRKGMLPGGIEPITRMQWMLLRHVHRSENCTMGDIADKFGVRPSTVSQMTDRLEKSALVERVSSQEDARRRVVRLTEKGEALIHSVKSISAEVLAKGLNQLTAAEQAHLIELLARLAVSMRDALETTYPNLNTEV